jgi:hypothetical protein
MLQAALNSMIGNHWNLDISSMSQININKLFQKTHNHFTDHRHEEHIGIVNSTIVADDVSNSFQSTAFNFFSAGIRVGSHITVSGFTEAANNDDFIVQRFFGGQIMVVDGDLTGEDFGDEITITLTTGAFPRQALVNSEFLRVNNLPASLAP